VFSSLEDAIERGSYFVGSPQQVVEQFHRYHAALGHEVQHTAGIGSPADPTYRAGIELFAAEVMPVVRRDLPDRLWDTTG
jgi:alkanesulfonate monooxygenase SsuD/methylene tetrahydromethanopterin reductase-like flavin-dependent oxidoreductase (luciferase family)